MNAGPLYLQYPKQMVYILIYFKNIIKIVLFETNLILKCDDPWLYLLQSRNSYVIRIIEKCNSIMITIMMNTIILVRQTNILSYYLPTLFQKNISKEFSNVNIIPPSYPKYFQFLFSSPCCMKSDGSSNFF